MSHPRPTGHLRSRVVDLVEGRLSDADEQRAREHVGGCRECAEAVRQQREVSERLRSSEVPAPDESLVAGLMSLSFTARLGVQAPLIADGEVPTRRDLADASASPGAAAARASSWRTFAPGKPQAAASSWGRGMAVQVPDTARWVFTAALVGGVSLAALGASRAATSITLVTPETSHGSVGQNVSVGSSATPTPQSTTVHVSTAWLRAGSSVEPITPGRSRD